MARNATIANVNELQGLYVCGYIQKRTRRMVPKDDPKFEIVTYELKDATSRSIYVDDIAPDPSDYRKVGSYVTLQVYVKPYERKNGRLSYTLCIEKDAVSSGEEF